MRRSWIVAAACALGLAAVGQAAAAPGEEAGGDERERKAKLEVVKRPAERFEEAIDTHKRRVERRRERREKAAQREAQEATPTPAEVGVSQGTLDAIASCESGGDPTAVNAAGYYGKYQFDLGTWASVGGTGNPAEAPESEQDHRAALLYQRAGASPWPNCGA